MAPRPLRVLLIEDNPDHAFIEKQAIEREVDARVEIEPEPEAGLRRLAEEPFDAVLLDYQLPGEDGLALLRRIKEGRRDLPVIVTTALGNEEVAVEAMKVGASDYLVKRFGGRGEAKLVAALKRAVAEAELGRAYRRSQDLLRKTLELAWDGVAHVSLESGRVLGANPALCRMLGAAPDGLDGRPLVELFAPQDRERVRRPPEGAEVEARLLRPDGTTVLVELRAAHAEIDGEPCALVTIRDTSEKRRLQEQLVQAQKLEAVGTLAGGIAHDFNNLLGAILGYASYLKRHVRPEDRLFRSIDTIESASERASELVRRLLSFSRRGPTERRPFSPNAVVEEMERLIARSLPKSISIRLELDPAVGAVEGDETQVQQVLLNICLNARDAMRDGGVLTIRTARARPGDVPVGPTGERPAAPFAVIAVRDTGAGMSEEVRARVFEPFFTTKPPGRGSGLGLATAYAIVKAHGGLLDLASEPGRGTEVRVYLPATEKPPEPRPLEEAALEREGRGTILVVDDEAAIRALTTDILEERGYDVLLASSGDEAIEVFRARGGEIDLVLLDVVMPGIHGIEALRRIRRLRPDARVLLSSGHSPEGAQEEGIAAGAVGWVAKPYRVGELVHTIREALARPLGTAPP